MSTPYTVFLQKPEDWPTPQLPDPPEQAPADTEADSGLPGEEKRNLARIVQAVNETWDYEDLARAATKAGGDEAWDRYHGRFDFSGKDDWQSKKVSSDFHMTIERLTSVIVRIFESSTDWVQVEATDDRVQYLYNMVKNLTLHYMERDEVNFKRILRQATKVMLLSQVVHLLVAFERNGWMHTDSGPGPGSEVPDLGMVSPDMFFSPFASAEEAAIRPSGDKKPTLPGRNLPRLRIEVLNPDYVVQDSSGRGRYSIWDVYYSKGEFLDEAAERGFDMDAARRTIARGIDGNETFAIDDAAKKNLGVDQRFRSKVKLRTFFGTLYDDKTGEALLRDEMVIIANDSEVVYGPVENPFWDGCNPIVSASPTETPFSPYGKSPVVADLDMFDVDIEFLNLMIDFFQKVLLGMTEVDLDMLEEDDEDFGAGFYPGRMIKTRKSGRPPGATAVQFLGGGDIPAGFWQFFQYFQMKHQGNTALADSLGGMPRTRGRITAFEFNKRASEAGNYINHVFTAIEDNLIAPALLLSFYRILQYLPDELWKEWVESQQAKIAPQDPALKQQWDGNFETIKNWTARERWESLAGYFRFRVRFYSALGDRQMQIEKGTLLLQTVSNIPAALQYLKMPELLRTLVRALGWDEEEIVSAEALPLPLIPGQPAPEALTPEEEAFMGEGPGGMPGQPPGMEQMMQAMMGGGGGGPQMAPPPPTTPRPGGGQPVG